MSLLHNALKKAEREEKSSHVEGEVFVDKEESKKTATHIYYIIGGFVVCLLLVIAVRFLKKPSMPPIAKVPIRTAVPLADTPKSEIGIKSAELTGEAFALIQAGRYEEARGRLERVVLLEPRNSEAYNNLGYVLRRLGMNEKAFEQYQKALSIDPQCGECINNLGVLYMVNRNLSEAQNQFRKVIEMKPEYPDPYLHLGLLLEAQGDLVGAKANYLKFVDLAKGVSADLFLKVQKRIASLQIP